jgi:hypothetical protein
MGEASGRRVLLRGQGGCGFKLQDRPPCAGRATMTDHPELVPAHSITLSARTKNDSGIVSLSALAVFKLMTRSNLVGCSMGRSAG